MNLDKVLAISGKPGLFALKVQTRTGFVAESYLDGKRVTVGLRSNVSLLTEVSIYTTSKEKPLIEVLRLIAKKENNNPTPDFKEDKVLMANYFLEILPDYDQDRVYTSDIKKILNWYNILQSKGLVSSEEPELKEEIPVEKVTPIKEEKTVAKPKTVATPKNAGMASAKKAPVQKATKSTKK